MNAMSRAIICYTSPIDIIKFVESEIKKGILQGIVSNEQLIEKASDQKKNLIQLITLRIFSVRKIDGIMHRSLIPFRVIKYITSNHLKVFIESAIGKASENFKDLYRNSLVTSCINSCYSLTLLFSGKQRADLMMRCLCRSVNVNLIAIMPTGGKFEYKVSNLFAGPVIDKINKNSTFHLLTSEEQNKKIKEYALPCINNFMQYMQPILDVSVSEESTDPEENNRTTISNFTLSCKKICYKFNKDIIDLLRNEIENKEINESKSNIYCIALVEESKGDSCFHHSFILEQFFCEKDKATRFKIYQSWIEKATIYDEICKRLYGDSGENSWDSEELDRFLDAFETLTCNRKDQNIQTIYEECFGYNAIRPPLINFNKQIFTGLSMRYYSTEINPEKCIENLANFVQATPELQIHP